MSSIPIYKDTEFVKDIVKVLINLSIHRSNLINLYTNLYTESAILYPHKEFSILLTNYNRFLLKLDRDLTNVRDCVSYISNQNRYLTIFYLEQIVIRITDQIENLTQIKNKITFKLGYFHQFSHSRTIGRLSSDIEAEVVNIGSYIRDILNFISLGCQKNEKAITPNSSINRVVCAAVRSSDGYVVLGTRHYSSDMVAQINARIDSEKFKNRTGDDQGFVDQDGKYLTREQAWVVAQVAGQIKIQPSTINGVLHSEDIY